MIFEEGERIGIIGSNGAGKTTLVKALFGLVKYRGSITTELKSEEMAVHLQFNEYVNTMSVKCIMETILRTSIRKNQKLQELIEYFGFGPCLGKRYKALSGGQRQLFTIIMVMMQDACSLGLWPGSCGSLQEERQKHIKAEDIFPIKEGGPDHMARRV